MEKNLSETGKNGTFTGVVRVLLNHRRETKQHTHQISHEDYLKEHKYHLIISFEGTREFKKEETESEEMVISCAKMHEQQLSAHLKRLANSDKAPSVSDRLHELGFQ